MFRRVAHLISWAEDQTGRISHILNGKKRQYEIEMFFVATDFGLFIRLPYHGLIILWLYGTRMDSQMMKDCSDFYCHRHEIMVSRCEYMNRCN
jgi:hypothetical protein